MASFIINKKKKYKFNVEVCLEELLEVPFVSAVLFAKLRHDASNFVGHSSREEVRDHTVAWHAQFSFPCKMSANASTGVLDRCVLRISVRKECKGGRSFTKLGFVDLNLAEYAGSVVPAKKALLEGYDTRHRLDNSMLKFSIKVHLLSGDTIFKVPSSSLKPEEVSAEDHTTENRLLDEFSSGSLAGSIASGSSGFGSLTKKRPQLLQSDLVIGGNYLPTYQTTTSDGGLDDQLLSSNQQQQQQQTTSNGPPQPLGTATTDLISSGGGQLHLEHLDTASCEPLGHSRNSSNTSQMSKASGYSSGMHSRQSSSGDSGHIRNGKPSGKRSAVIKIPSTLAEIPSPIPKNRSVSYQNGSIGASSPEDVYLTPRSSIGSHRDSQLNNKFLSQLSTCSNLSDEYATPDCTQQHQNNKIVDFFYRNINNNMDSFEMRLKNDSSNNSSTNRSSLQDHQRNQINNNLSNNQSWTNEGVLRSQSDFLIPQRISPDSPKKATSFSKFKGFLTPQTRRKEFKVAPAANSTPNKSPSNSLKIKLPSRNGMFPIPTKNNPINRSTTSLKFYLDQQQLGGGISRNGRGMPHHRVKILDGATAASVCGGAGGGKLATVVTSPDDDYCTISNGNSATSQLSSNAATATVIVAGNNTLNSVANVINTASECSNTMNPSSGSLVVSETGSLDRPAKVSSSAQSQSVAQQRRKHPSSSTAEETDCLPPGRVEGTRVDVDDFISDLLTQTNLNPIDDSNENSGLQLFIAKDGTAALGNHEVKSAGIFKQVFVEDNR